MSQENVEVVRRFIEALPRAQASDDWQPVLAEVNPDVEIEDLDISLDTERYRGHDSVRKWIGVWMESWENWTVEDVQVRPVGEDRAIGLFLVHAKGLLPARVRAFRDHARRMLGASRGGQSYLR